MKTNRSILPILAAALLAHGTIQAQTSEVPSFISYQGIVSDGATLIGSGTPVNRDIEFRVYDAASAGTLVYSEKQTVTIADGEFSVLVGAGSAISGEEATGPGTISISDVFDDADRFLGVKIDIDGGGFNNDGEISPRQQIVTTAFAFRSKVAESALTALTGPSGGVFSADQIGIGTANPVTPLQVISGDNTYGIQNTNSSGVSVANWLGASDARFGTRSNHNLGFYTNNSQPHMTLTTAGNVGIGTTSPTSKLHVETTATGFTDVVKASAPGDPGAGATRIVAENSQSKIALSAYGGGGTLPDNLRNSAALVATSGDRMILGTGPGIPIAMYSNNGYSHPDLFIATDGNVGIGTTTPATKLTVSTPVSTPGIEHTNGTVRVGTYTGNTNGGMFGTFSNHKLSLFANGAGNIKVVVEPDGKVGIGTTTPDQPLEVSGTYTPNNGQISMKHSESEPTRLFMGAGTAGGVIGVVNADANSSGGIAFQTSTGASASTRMIVSHDGKVGIGTTTPTYPLTVAGGIANDSGNALIVLSDFINAQLSGMVIDGKTAGNSGRWDVGAANSDGTFYIRHYGTTTTGVSLGKNANAWAALSDRNAKKSFSPINTTEILEKLVAVPITKWHYKSQADDETLNIGPMAQDFKAAFYPGRDDTRITTLEFDGVALAAIQGLNSKLENQLAERDKQISALESRLAALEARDKERDAKFAKLEKLLEAQATVAPVSTEVTSR